ncbi:retrotransposon protein, putative, ty1-copia subclass [Tanacetum coccineum]|uniref:Retrotransposon protein, putative, ty1-copia subclass n=1 Tax=Tanacetum coccineum TaxID=301880 RepID=A0ABQ5G8B6_9ASTR
MHNMGKTIGEIHAMLIEYEKGLPKKAETPQVKGKERIRRFNIPKPKNPKPTAMERPAKDDACHHCKEVGHWKRNCPVYLAELLKKKKQVGSGSSLVHHLVENGFVQRFTDFGILVSKNNVHYFNAIPSNGIYEIDMHNLVPNVNSIYNVSTKRAKHNLDSTYLWHCRLAHISKKRIEKLQHEGLLKSTDDESFDQCVSCLSGKMTRKSFPHRPERATDLLGIIHTDVCGPLRHVSKQGASYFITFTDDYSRYDQDGEYISQDFKDYLKACRIVQQLTHPYTPQHNGVSERRNYTLLDMVRSMMNLTTLPLSFWDYALESATRILNMVPTKKVDKTPYELWYVKVPNLSYLKVWGCEALVKRDMPEKLQQRSIKCIFIGYPKETMGYYFYFPPENENKIVVARILISIAAFYAYEIWQMDVKTAFLNGYLDEDIYMVRPEGFVDPKHPRKEFIAWLGIVPKIIDLCNMYCDNSAAIHYANKPGVQKGARHYHRRYHYVCECVELGEIRILKVHTDNNLVDPFTKALSNRKLTQHARSMGLHPASSFM